VNEHIIDLDAVVKQAWHSKGKEAMRREVEERLCQARGELLQRLRDEGRKAYRWGFVTRKSLLTFWGELGPIRIPRLRSDGREIRIIPNPAWAGFDWHTFHEVAGGLSQRKTCRNLFWRWQVHLSTPTIGTLVKNLGEEVLLRRYSSITPDEYVGLAVDGIWGHYRRGEKAVLLTAIGVRHDGSFSPLDWEAGHGESLELATRLFNRLWHRGLTQVGLIVSDGAEGLHQARQMVYPEAAGQLCLWHWERTLLGRVDIVHRERFNRDYWEVYGGLDLHEVCARAADFKARWRRIAPQAIADFAGRFRQTVAFLKYPPRWRHRLRTVNLAEGFFKNFRRFLSRYPGLLDEEHFCRCLGIYLLSAAPERWCPRRLRAAV